MALWMQALSARAFGFNTWSLLLPQALAGVLTIWIVHHVVRRSFAWLTIMDLTAPGSRPYVGGSTDQYGLEPAGRLQRLRPHRGLGPARFHVLRGGRCGASAGTPGRCRKSGS
ncbi:glycosyltransferase family 39 protein [Saccharopolyspora sp. NPDC000995]